MKFEDRYGLTLSAKNPKAVEIYFNAVDSAIAGNAFSEDWFAEAALLDRSFPLAQGALALVKFNEGKPNEAQQLINDARINIKDISQRELQHLGILQLLINNQNNQALEAIIEHCKDYPTDVLLISKAVDGFGLFAFNGEKENPQQRLDFMNSIAKNYHNDWWFSAMYSFALVENFQLTPAQKMAEEALRLNPKNGHAAHSYAHVCYETEQTDACIDFLSQWLQNYNRKAHLYGHNYWHWAMSELVKHNFDKVKEIYHNHLSPLVALGGAVGLVADAAALDWRSNLDGLALLAPLEKDCLAEYALDNPMEDVLFGEAHLALIFANPKFEPQQQHLKKEIEKRWHTLHHPKYQMMLHLINGVKAFHQGEYKKTILELEKAKPELNRLGGSNAQRELFEDTLIKAHLEAGNASIAKSLIETRLHRRKGQKS